MCGRFAQSRSQADYLRELNAGQPVVGGDDNVPLGRYHVVPGNCVPILHCTAEGLRIDPCHWGWAPFWASGNRTGSASASAETVTTGPQLKALWPQGRALMLVDGWYEWLSDPQDPQQRQPCFIRLKSQAPMLIAALAHVRVGLAPNEGDGFVILTAASDARWPLVLAPEEARAWIAPHAGHQVQEQCLPVEAFECLTLDLVEDGTGFARVRG